MNGMPIRFIRRLADLAYGDISYWVGERAAVRGFDCRDRVGEIFARLFERYQRLTSEK